MKDMIVNKTNFFSFLLLISASSYPTEARDEVCDVIVETIDRDNGAFATSITVTGESFTPVTVVMNKVFKKSDSSQALTYFLGNYQIPGDANAGIRAYLSGVNDAIRLSLKK